MWRKTQSLTGMQIKACGHYYTKSQVCLIKTRGIHVAFDRCEFTNHHRRGRLWNCMLISQCCPARRQLELCWDCKWRSSLFWNLFFGFFLLPNALQSCVYARQVSSMLSKVDWLIDWLIRWLTDWPIDWLIDWFTEWLIWFIQVGYFPSNYVEVLKENMEAKN